MSVSAEIVIEDSGDGLIVPVSSALTSGDTEYVYLAPKGSAVGDVITLNILRGGEEKTVEITITQDCLTAY